MPSQELLRRDFLAGAGAGLYVVFGVEAATAQEPARQPRGLPYPTDLNAYLKIGEDGRVTCFVGKVELGQGAMTSLAQALAEELDVPFDSVSVVMGDTDLCPWDVGTFGSLCTPFLVPVVRRAGAEARSALLALAAERLSVPLERLVVKDGVVSDRAQTTARVGYGALIQGRRIERHVANVPVKPVTAFRVIGRSLERKDGLDKVTGTAVFAGDHLLPGMLHARILRPPAHGAKLRSADTSAAEKIGGVRVVKDGDLIAVLHERRDIATDALAQVKAEFEPGPSQPDDRTIFDHLLKTAPAAKLVAGSGDLAAGESLSQLIVEQTYLNSYVAHAPIETHSATATVESGKIMVWASTQAPFIVRTQVAGALGVRPEDVRIISHYVGGGFGGKTEADQAVEAARLARAVGRPVQVVWSREEEFFYDRFRPAAVMKVRSGVTSAGKIVLWDSQVYGAGDREAKPFYDIPHQRTVAAGSWQGGNPPGMHPFRVGPWRAPSVNSNTFARESQLDIMAARIGVDPLAFRLKNLSDARMRRALEMAAAKIAWKSAPRPTGLGYGIACGMYANACNATAVEVGVDRPTGRVRVKKVVVALDVGVVMNPDGLRQQAEGSVTMGLGYALTEEVDFRGGAVLHKSFDGYEIPRFSSLPQIDVLLIDNPGTPALGGGEPPIITMGAAIANAIFDAVGARVLQLPMTPERVKAAMPRT